MKLWYAVQTQPMREGGQWDNGSYNRDEAMKMLMSDAAYVCIAVIDDEAKVCVGEINK